MKKHLVFLALTALIAVLYGTSAANNDITCWFPPGWEAKNAEIKAIVNALTQKSGLTVKPLVAKNYPQILHALNSEKLCLVYAGSFTQAIIQCKGLGTPLVQAIDGKELYSGIMVYPQGEDPAALLKEHPDQIAFAVGASSGESAAKAATQGKASIGVPNHNFAASAVATGKAKAAFVKNWWWEDNKSKFPTLAAWEVPEVSEVKNPDNILIASKAVSADQMKKLSNAALTSKEAFNAKSILPITRAGLEFSLGLMKKGKIDPLTYTW